MMHARPMWKDGLHAQWYALLTNSRTLQRGCIADGKPGPFFERLYGYLAKESKSRSAARRHTTGADIGAGAWLETLCIAGIRTSMLQDVVSSGPVSNVTSECNRWA